MLQSVPSHVLIQGVQYVLCPNNYLNLRFKANPVLIFWLMLIQKCLYWMRSFLLKVSGFGLVFGF